MDIRGAEGERMEGKTRAKYLNKEDNEYKEDQYTTCITAPAEARTLCQGDGRSIKCI